MQRLPSRGKSQGRPSTLQNTKSFSRYEIPSPTTPSRTRATTVQGVPIPDYAAIMESPSSWKNNGDVFEHPEAEQVTDEDTDKGTIEDLAAIVEDLPDELQELLDSFLESLGAKVHPTPLSIEQLSDLFQDFYEHAQTKIDDHIALLAQRYPGSSSQTPSVKSASSALSKGGGRRTLRSSMRASPRGDSGEHQQMLTPTEVQYRRKARKQLEVRRRALEELVEKEVCERVYSRVWRHRTTDDEERDEKLRSRAAALAVVGISLKELLSSALSDSADLHATPEPESADVKERLTEARMCLERMNQEKYPLGKLNHLKAAHKSIVETLQQLFPSSSSADEVLPTLIYSIVTSKPDSSHTVSNFNYIQRFRNQAKVDGEAAYCLTNLEAAITFLETVDLSSIRANEKPEGPERSGSRPETPQHEIPNPLYHGLPSDSDSPGPQKAKILTKTRSRANSSATTRPRGSSFMSQPSSKASEYPVTPTDAVRQAADEALDAMHNALDNSFKFFFGKLQERQSSTGGPDHIGKLPTPKTLADAHKLVSEHPEDEDEFGDEEPVRPNSRDENSNALLRAIGGMRPRERSVDSGRSNESARKISFAAGSSPSVPVGRSVTTPVSSVQAFGSSPPVSAAAVSAVDTMRNLGSSLNPLKGWGGVGMMRGFARNVSGTSPIGTSSPTATLSIVEREPEKKRTDTEESAKVDISGIPPGIQRFVECKDARELNGHDVDILLRDYQRLAGALKAAGIAAL